MKFGICSEIFKDWNDIDRTVNYVKEVGYDGLEIAPFTFAPYVTSIPASTREHIVRAAAAAELEIAGIHWVMIGPEGMHLTHPSKDVRDRTAQYCVDLVHFCGDIGGKVIVFGSPKQRNLMEGVTFDQGMSYAQEVLEPMLPVCEERGVTFCIEPLSHQETNFLQNAAEAGQLVERMSHPNFQMILDVKAMTPEQDDRPVLIRRHANNMAHFHANDANLEGPGFGEVDFGPIFEALKEINYQHYVSVEVFKFDAGPEAIATKSLEYMKQFV